MPLLGFKDGRFRAGRMSLRGDRRAVPDVVTIRRYGALIYKISSLRERVVTGGKAGDKFAAL
jgi:hypothetical protein